MIASFADIWSENIGRLSLDYQGFVGTSVQDRADVVLLIVGIFNRTDDWSFVSGRVSKRFHLWNTSKVAGVSFGRIN